MINLCLHAVYKMFIHPCIHTHSPKTICNNQLILNAYFGLWEEVPEYSERSQASMKTFSSPNKCYTVQLQHVSEGTSIAKTEINTVVLLEQDAVKTSL